MEKRTISRPSALPVILTFYTFLFKRCRSSRCTEFVKISETPSNSVLHMIINFVSIFSDYVMGTLGDLSGSL